MGNAVAVPVSMGPTEDVPNSDDRTKDKSAEEESEAVKLFRKNVGTISVMRKTHNGEEDEDFADDISSLHQNTWSTLGTATIAQDPPLRFKKSQCETGSISETKTRSTEQESDASQESSHKERDLSRQSDKKLINDGNNSPACRKKENDSPSPHHAQKSCQIKREFRGNPTNSKTTNKKDKVIMNMQKKMAKVDQEQSSCLDQIKTMNNEIESYRRATIRKMKEKDDTIDLNMTEIAFLKQQMLQVKTEYQDHLSLTKTETNKVMRKLTAVQNQLKVAELEKDEAVKQMEQMKNNAANTAANRKSSVEGETSSKKINTAKDATKADTSGLEQAIHDLINQLEVAEEAHQRERDDLNGELQNARKALKEKESECIALERDRDDALQQIEIRNQLLELEKSLHASSEKQHLEEINTWKSLYEQEVHFTPQKRQDTAKRLKKAATLVGNRLGKGILKGIQEEDNRSRASTAITMNTLDDANSEAQFTNMAEYAIATKLLNGSHLSNCSSSMNSGHILDHVPAPMMPTLEHSGTGSTFPTYIPEGSSGKASGEAFQEVISIPNFLSKVW